MTSTKLQRMLVDVRREVMQAKARMPESELYRRLQEAPPVRSLENALRQGFGLIAEIKAKSPSGGAMLAENVQQAAEAYEESSIVRAVSILTNETHFGMGINRLASLREKLNKPILRKDFIVDRYQILEARAFGADAILLMGNVLNADQLDELSALAEDLGLEVLFESHTQTQIEHLPKGRVRLCGVNSRLMDSGTRRFLGLFSRYSLSRFWMQRGSQRDLSTDFKKFRSLFHRLPKNAVKVAESGISSSSIGEICRIGYDAALVGNSLLLAREGIKSALGAFEGTIRQFNLNQTPALFQEKEEACSSR